MILGSNVVRATLWVRPGTLDTRDTDRAVDLMGETEMLVSPVVALDPSVEGPMRRGSITGRADEPEEMLCLLGDTTGIDRTASMLRAEDDDDALRGMGMLDDLEGREFMLALKDRLKKQRTSSNRRIVEYVYTKQVVRI